MEGGRGDLGGDRVGDGNCLGGTSGAGVGVAIGIGVAVGCSVAVAWGVRVAVGAFPPQADTTKLRPTTVRNTVDDGMLIGASFESDFILLLSKA